MPKVHFDRAWFCSFPSGIDSAHSEAGGCPRASGLLGPVAAFLVRRSWCMQLMLQWRGHSSRVRHISCESGKPNVQVVTGTAARQCVRLLKDFLSFNLECLLLRSLMQKVFYFFVQIIEVDSQELAFQNGCLNIPSEHDLKILCVPA